MKKNTFYIIIFVVLILIVIIASYLLNKLNHGNLSYIPSEEYATTSPSNAPFSNTNEEGYSLYTNNKYGFSIMYPTSLQKVDPEKVTGLTDDLDISDIFVGEIPKETFAGTNLYEVRIIAGAKKTDANTCAYILAGNDVRKLGNNSNPETKTINGIQFTKAEISDAGAGNYYVTTRYSTIKAGVCYEVLAVAHSANIDLLRETNPNIKQYNPKDYMTEFEEIVSFFKFTK